MARVTETHRVVPKTPFEVRRLGFRGEQLVAFVRSELDRKGVSPSYREAMIELGLDSKGHVCNIARRAEKQGSLKREGSGRNRRLKLG